MLGTHHVPGQPEGCGDMPPVPHRFEQGEGHPFLSVLAGQQAVEGERLAIPAHADPHFMGCPPVAPGVVEDRVAPTCRLSTQRPFQACQFAIAQRRKQQCQFARNQRPRRVGNQDVLRWDCGEAFRRFRLRLANLRPQQKPGFDEMHDLIHALLKRPAIRGGDGDDDLHIVQRVAQVEFFQRLAAVNHLLDRAAVLAARRRQMHRISLHHALDLVDGIVAIPGFGDIHAQRQREIGSQQLRQRTTKIPDGRLKLIAGKESEVMPSTGATGWREMPTAITATRFAEFVVALKQRGPGRFHCRRIK